MSASDPESVFVVERAENELRISRVRTDDGSVLWTHADRRGYIEAAAIAPPARARGAGPTLGFVLADPFDDGDEPTAAIVGLSLATGAELYRIEI